MESYEKRKTMSSLKRIDLNEENRSQPVIFFVIPCYNEEEQLPITAPVLSKKITSMIDNGQISPSSRVLFVDDGSKDNTWSVITSLNTQNSTLFHGTKLAHNRGHQNALLAGLMTALHQDCDATISLDADLQDDINVFDQFVSEYTNGAEIVYGVRSSRARDTWFKRNTAEAFYRLNGWMGAETIRDHADYRLMGHAALEALSQYREVNLFLRGIVPDLGFKTAIVTYKRGKRAAGESKYPLGKMISFAIQGITSFSVKPLHFVTGLGCASIIVGIIMFIYVIASWVNNEVVSGWGSMMCSLWLIGGMLMVSMGIVGEYIGKIYLETKHRPRYIIEQEI